MFPVVLLCANEWRCVAELMARIDDLITQIPDKQLRPCPRP
jgi:hypothetical protein